MAGRSLTRKIVHQNKVTKPKVVERTETKAKEKQIEPFYRTKQYFVFAHELTNIVSSALPEGIKFTKKEKYDRVSWRKGQLENKIKEIEGSNLSRAEKNDIIPRFQNWVKNFENLLKKIKEEK
jgi:hypothetical protein